jgi:hypothetical protein
MVGAEYASKFQGIIDYLDNVGYNIYSLGGYNDRDIAGQPGVKSVHAHGGAIDINPRENPLGSKLVTDMPPNIGQTAASMGLGWGGNWRSFKDAMHFSVAQNEGGTVDLSKRGARTGGIFKGPSTGYEVELHGEEIVTPAQEGVSKQALGTTMFDMDSQLQERIISLFEAVVEKQDAVIELLDDHNNNSRKLVNAMA